MNMELTITHDQLLKKFISDDPFRPILNTPVLIDNIVCATNAHVLIKCPVSLLEDKYLPNEAFPDIKKAYECVEYLDNPLTIEGKNLNELLSKIDKYEKFEDCDQCNGDGVVECQCCGHDSDCIECNGSGESRVSLGFRFNKQYDTIKIGEAYFNPNYIQLLSDVQFLERSTIEVLSLKHNKSMVCKIGRIETLIMPVMSDPYLDIKVHELIINP
jgi:hypothetical protein